LIKHLWALKGQSHMEWRLPHLQYYLSHIALFFHIALLVIFFLSSDLCQVKKWIQMAIFLS
jgi:hypothetical protein